MAAPRLHAYIYMYSTFMKPSCIYHIRALYAKAQVKVKEHDKDAYRLLISAPSIVSRDLKSHISLERLIIVRF